VTDVNPLHRKCWQLGAGITGRCGRHNAITAGDGLANVVGGSIRYRWNARH